MGEIDELDIQHRNIRLIDDVCMDANFDCAINGYVEEPLLPLIDACQPLINIVQNIDQYAQIALEHTEENPPDGLTRDESASIRLYTMEWTQSEGLYSILNQTLNKSDYETLKPWFKYLKLFLTGLFKIPCLPFQTIWRGIKNRIENEFLCQTEVIWWAFSSCTTSLPVLENEIYLGHIGERTLFSIEAFNGRNIKDHSDFSKEDEILLMPGTILEVKSQFDPAQNLHIVHLKQRIHHQTLLQLPFEGASLFPKDQRDLPSISLKPVRWYTKKRFLLPISCFIMACLLTIILASVLTSRSSAPPCWLIFEPTVSYSTGFESPDSLAVGDLNNDTQLDIVVAINHGQSIGIFLANGNGTFEPIKIILIGSNPWSLILTDFNNDNQLDIAVTNGIQNMVGVLLGHGDGTFSSQMIFPTPSNPWSIAVGDLNNDTYVDIVSTNHDSSTLGVLLGYGNGTFAMQRTFPIGNYSYSVAVGDFNNDTFLDIAVVNHADNNLSILIGYGNGSFASQMTFSTGREPSWIAIGDLNNDNRLDIGVTNQLDNDVSILLGNGDGTFSSQTTFSTGNNPQHLTFNDLNNDKYLDLIVTNYATNTISILQGYGNGIFAPQITLRTGNNPYMAAIGDLNNDNRLDITVANYQNEQIQMEYHLEYLDQFLQLKCAPHFISMGLFPNAKEITESFAMWTAIRQRILTQSPPLDQNDKDAIIVVGDGMTPRTAALCAFLTNDSWKCFSIDPMLQYDSYADMIFIHRQSLNTQIQCQQWKDIQRLTMARAKIQSVSIQCRQAIIVLMHAHVSLEDVFNSIQSSQGIIGIVTCPCCNWKSLQILCQGIKPHQQYQDPRLLSQRNEIYIWSFTTPYLHKSSNIQTERSIWGIDTKNIQKILEERNEIKQRALKLWKSLFYNGINAFDNNEINQSSNEENWPWASTVWSPKDILPLLKSFTNQTDSPFWFQKSILIVGTIGAIRKCKHTIFYQLYNCYHPTKLKSPDQIWNCVEYQQHRLALAAFDSTNERKINQTKDLDRVQILFSLLHSKENNSFESEKSKLFDQNPQPRQSLFPWAISLRSGDILVAYCQLGLNASRGPILCLIDGILLFDTKLHICGVERRILR